MEPFNGKAGCVSFYGLTHQSVEEAKLVSAPFNENQGSLFWLLGPIALIGSLILPQFFIGSLIEGFFRNEVLLEMIVSLTFEAFFYIGMAIFLTVTDKIQRPYLQFSAKRWGLITGLRGYMSSSFFTMGIKVIAPILVAAATWSSLGLPVLVAVIPFLLSCAAQLAFERHLDKHESSCWPLVPIIFEVYILYLFLQRMLYTASTHMLKVEGSKLNWRVYRLYQLTKATHFIEKLIFSTRGLPETAQLLEKGNAYVGMVFTFQILGIVVIGDISTEAFPF